MYWQHTKCLWCVTVYVNCLHLWFKHFVNITFYARRWWRKGKWKEKEKGGNKKKGQTKKVGKEGKEEKRKKKISKIEENKFK